MKYDEAIEYMESLSDEEWVETRDTFHRLCEKLGNPWQELSFIHIAAGDHKGSVPAYVSFVLQAAGYKVGRYIPQTILRFSERLQVGNKPITKKYFAELTQRIKDACQELVEEGYPAITLYEAEAAMMFLCFKEHGVQAVVAETGMGTRNHSFNRIIEEWMMQHYPPIEMEMNSTAKRVRYGLKKQRFDYREWRGLEITSPGVGRLESAVNAVRIIESLQEMGYTITEKALRKGLAEASFVGDFSVFGKNPYMVMDPVHTTEDALELSKSIQTYNPVFASSSLLYSSSVNVCSGRTMPGISTLVGPTSASYSVPSTSNVITIPRSSSKFMFFI
jgi:dihydrofolate synthase/folylpolyglutamate synthase